MNIKNHRHTWYSIKNKKSTLNISFKAYLYYTLNDASFWEVEDGKQPSFFCADRERKRLFTIGRVFFFRSSIGGYILKIYPIPRIVCKLLNSFTAFSFLRILPTVTSTMLEVLIRAGSQTEWIKWERVRMILGWIIK